jgi:hypothetical protein
MDEEEDPRENRQRQNGISENEFLTAQYSPLSLLHQKDGNNRKRYEQSKGSLRQYAHSHKKEAESEKKSLPLLSLLISKIEKVKRKEDEEA